jgi:hypothetical protein
VFTLEREYTIAQKGKQPDTSLQIHNFDFSIAFKMFKRYCKYECMTIQKDISVINIVESSWLFAICMEWGMSVASEKTPFRHPISSHVCSLVLAWEPC